MIETVSFAASFFLQWHSFDSSCSERYVQKTYDKTLKFNDIQAYNYLLW